MKKLILTSFLGLAVAGELTMSSCKKKESTPVAPTTGSMDIRFDYVFGSAQLPWELNKQIVHPKTGDTLTFTTFKFYVSNIKLKKADGTWWAQPESYYLVNAESVTASTMTINDIPVGEYTELQYTMGVDSARNVSGANTGALSLANGMFWDWNSGYIMLKAEGKSPNAINGGFALHLGGFTGTNNIVTVKSTDFNGTPVQVLGTNKHTVKLLANPARLWHTSPGVATTSAIHMPGAEAKTMAKDFYDNISYTGME